MLYLSGPGTQLNGCVRLELLYSTLVHPGGFDEMINSILESHLPTLMLFQHEEQYTALHDRSVFSKSHIFGAISNSRWFNTGQACGVPSDAIFSLYPNYQMLYGRKDKACSRNYCYLNYPQKNEGKPDHPQGIGFGGSADGHNCRIWIDRNLENSYVRDDDASYESGPLVQKHVKTLRITLIEVWGIVHPQHEEDADDVNNQIRNIHRNQFLEDNEKQRQSDLLKAQGTESFYWRAQKEADFYWMQSSEDEDDYYRNEQGDRVEPLTKQQVSRLPKSRKEELNENQHDAKIETQSQKSNHTDYKSEALSRVSQRKNADQRQRV